jgi:hypothetical protein
MTVGVKQIDVRFAALADGKLELDEVVAHDATVHLEKMTDGLFVLVVETRHERAAINIYTKNPKAHLTADEFSHEAINRRSEAQRRRWNSLTPEQRRRRRRA